MNTHSLSSVAQSHILVDTSVWISFLSVKKNNSSFNSNHFKKILDFEKAVITDIILNEILVGASTAQEFEKLNRMFSAIPLMRVKESDLDELNLFAFTLKKKGLLAKYSDLTIAFLAKKNGLHIYSLDQYFKKLAEHKIISITE